MPLSDLSLRKAKPTGKAYELSDGRGLSARVSPKGLITFQYRFRFAGKPQRMDLGHYPAMSLAEAREAHFRAIQVVTKGLNPITAREEARRAHRDANTVEQLTEEFLQRHVRPFHRDPSQAESIFRANVLPSIGKVKITEVKRRDIIKLLERIVDRGAPVMANRTASLTKQMFSFAVARGLIESHPCPELTRTSIGGPEKPRQQYLSYRQIWLLNRNLPHADFSAPLKIAIKLLLATGQRRGELMNAKWEHFALDKRLWVIPSELSKNSKQHIVHLSPLTLELLDQLKIYSRGNSYLLPSADRTLPMTCRALNKAIDRHIEVLGIGKFSPHVLRHTFSTQVSGLGVPPHVVEKLLNHSFTGMLAVYNHHDYFRERASALVQWAEVLARLFSVGSEDELPREPQLNIDRAASAIQAAEPMEA